MHEIVYEVGPNRAAALFLVPVRPVQTPRDYVANAVAARVAANFGAPLDTEIMANNPKGPRLREFGWFDLGAAFCGGVQPGAEYLLVTDIVAQGGTIACLRGYIEGRGGHVIGVTALTTGHGSDVIALTPETLRDLRAKHGDLEDWWRERYWSGFDTVTEVEARCLCRFESGDAIRCSVGIKECMAGSNADIALSSHALMDDFLDSRLHLDDWLVERGLLGRWLAAWDAAHWDYEILTSADIVTAREDYLQAAVDCMRSFSGKEPQKKSWDWLIT